MIIPFPDRIPMLRGTLFALVLSVGLVMTGTGPIFSGLAFIFVVASVMGFNLGGGMTRPSGNYVFFFAVLVVILGLMVKVVIREPAESQLKSPITTMAAYTGGMLVMVLSVFISGKLSRKDGLLQSVVADENMSLAAIGCTVAGIVIPILANLVVESKNETFLPLATASSQFNRFLAMAVILGTTHEIKSSGGKRSVNFTVLFAGSAILFQGFVLDFSKEALFTAPLCWVASGAALRYRYNFKQVIGFVLAMLFCGYFLIPYSQYGRIFRDPTLTMQDQLAISVGLFSNLTDLREKYKDDQETQAKTEGALSFFNEPMNIFDRLEMFGIDDALNTVTDQKGTFGYSRFPDYLVSIVPRIFWKDKPTGGTGNQFAHEVGYNEEDTTTGISISAVGEAYHEGKWFGVLVVEPIFWIPFFTIMDSLCGDMRKSPWGILVLAIVAHIAPEGALQGVFYTMTYGAFIVLTVAFVSAYLMPLLAALITPPKKKLVIAPLTARAAGPAFTNAQPTPLKR